ncbi:MAG TPA: cellobiose phosphorylase, partial [Candidatus Omnitrophota bacterium]|nr:cellobiose phosphorylase [Candidatus Omnitrophota bacterium]
EAPQAIIADKPPVPGNIQGKEAFGGLKFKKSTLKPGHSCTYIVVAGIVADAAEASEISARFDTPAKIEEAFSANQTYWKQKADDYTLRTSESDFDNWFKWVSIQPTLRRIFGCSFLPDFDYGKGGRGWRDLWQDCLGLILSSPEQVRELLLNNFSGVRIDGSNATIIGKASGEFISDRNNVSRVWMDHGVWPLLTLELYINETGDKSILLEKVPYFQNHERSRSRVIDREWKEVDGRNLKTSSGESYLGTIFEHILVENLVQFFNVGSHNYIRLEGADWNDGLDMAKQHGESVAFTAMYARNLESLAVLIDKMGDAKVNIAGEIGILLSKCDYDHIGSKHEILNKYFHATNHGISGEIIEVAAQRLAGDLRGKASWMMQNIRKREWLAAGFFNGYYNNDKERVEGRFGKDMRISLTSQVFPIMSGTATDGHVRKILASARKYLYDKSCGGYRLNTDFKKEAHNLGRAFSFAYGEKENGAVFNHMVVMLAYGLYRRGFAAEGWSVLRSIADMSLNVDKSKIYPCLPEYFNGEGRGMYSYLTGSASWFVLTLLTEAFGLKGEDGDLLIDPKFSSEQFTNSNRISVNRRFAGRSLVVTFYNPKKKGYGRYKISRITMGGKILSERRNKTFKIERGVIESMPAEEMCEVGVFLD